MNLDYRSNTALVPLFHKEEVVVGTSTCERALIKCTLTGCTFCVFTWTQAWAQNYSLLIQDATSYSLAFNLFPSTLLLCNGSHNVSFTCHGSWARLDLKTIGLLPNRPFRWTSPLSDTNHIMENMIHSRSFSRN